VTYDDAIDKIAEDYVPVSYRRTLRFLERNGPAHVLDIAHHLGRGPKSVSNMLNELKQKRVICVAVRRRKDNGRPTVFYGLGNKDCPNLGPRPPEVRRAVERNKRLLSKKQHVLEVWGV